MVHVLLFVLVLVLVHTVRLGVTAAITLHSYFVLLLVTITVVQICVRPLCASASLCVQST